MNIFWKWVTARLVTGKTNGEKNSRLNQLLPAWRPKEVEEARANARSEVKGLTKLAIGGSFAAMAVLAGLTEVVRADGRNALALAAGALAFAGVSATISLMFGILEPTAKAAVARRLEYPEDPVTDEDDFLFSEAVSERLWDGERVVRSAMIWHAALWGQRIFFFMAALAFCAALFMAVGAFVAVPAGA